MAVQEHTRRLITLIFAGWNRMVMIRRELPRTKRAGWVRKPCRIEHKEDSPFRGPCAVTGSAVQSCIPAITPLRRLGELVLLLRSYSDRPNETEQFASQRRDNLVFVFSPRRHRLVAFVQALLGLPGDVLHLVTDGQVLLTTEQI